MARENIIVSPSGQLYGSENVLLDFLEGSSKDYVIYAPKDSVLYTKLKHLKYRVIGFKNLKWLYSGVFVKLLFSRKSLYLNEAGHISYVKLLAFILPFRKFVVSVRLLEDCNLKLKKVPKNITLIPVSHYLKNQITTNAEVYVVYDPYKLSNTSSLKKENKWNKGQFTIGIVGRIVKSKGLNDLVNILEQLAPVTKEVVIIAFYGNYDPTSSWFIHFKRSLDSINGFKYVFYGFTESQIEIYTHCNLIIHLNKVEALGRIIFEAIDYETPFLCYKAGGAGELAQLLGFLENTIEPGSNSVYSYKSKILEVMNHTMRFDFESAKKNIAQNFSLSSYATQIENHL